MLPYSYLVLGVDPISNESRVDVNTKISVTFAKHINTDTLNSNTVRLRKVNGDFVEHTGSYNSVAKVYEMKPKAPLSPNTQYQTLVVGGVNGVLSIDGSYLPSTKTYEFVTVPVAVQLSLSNLRLKQDYLFVSAEWDIPNGLMEGEQVLFNVKLGRSTNPEAADLWPLNVLEGKTTSTKITIPYRLEPEQSYYVHVNAIAGDKSSPWITEQLYIEGTQSAPLNPTPTTPPETGELPVETPVFNQLSMVDHYPNSQSYEKPEEIVILFDGALDPTHFGPEQDSRNPLFYVVQQPYLQTMSVFDTRGKYSVKNALPGRVSVAEDNPNLLVFTPEKGSEAFLADKEYTVIVSKDISGINSLPVGSTYVFGFKGTPLHMYGSLAQIQEVGKKFGKVFPDWLVQSIMKKHSQYAMDIWMESSTYDEELTRDGGAPYFVHEYVNTQATIDVLVNGGISSATSGGESIKLGDLHVSREAGDSAEDSTNFMIGQLTTQLKAWTDLLHGRRNRGYAKAGTAVKGESGAAYPEYLTRSSLRDFDA